MFSRLLSSVFGAQNAYKSYWIWNYFISCLSPQSSLFHSVSDSFVCNFCVIASKHMHHCISVQNKFLCFSVCWPCGFFWLQFVYGIWLLWMLKNIIEPREKRTNCFLLAIFFYISRLCNVHRKRETVAEQKVASFDWTKSVRCTRYNCAKS